MNPVREVSTTPVPSARGCSTPANSRLLDHLLVGTGEEGSGVTEHGLVDHLVFVGEGAVGPPARG